VKSQVIKILCRPPGHITGLMTRLQKWKENREKRGLPAYELELSISYLKEYREITTAIRKQNISILKVEDEVCLVKEQN
jgi:hypothetical protein